MNSKKGFTLVELLVVMAIIAILASIVVPNVQRYIVRARVTRAVAEVSGMELSLTAIMTDAGRGNFGQMFMPNAAPRLGWPESMNDLSAFNPQIFNTAADVYAQIAYDLLRLGRDCLRAGSETIAQDFIQHDILANLGPNYMDIGLDPWGEVYRVFPGPWRHSTEGLPADVNYMGRTVELRRWPIPFRVFSVEAGAGGNVSFAVQTDPFTLRGSIRDKDNISFEIDRVPTLPQVDAPEIWPSRVGLPAQANKSVFIWSYGQNNRSSQMLYRASYDINNPGNWFHQEAEEDIGGGDDINNWDSGNSWQRFYM